MRDREGRKRERGERKEAPSLAAISLFIFVTGCSSLRNVNIFSASCAATIVGGLFLWAFCRAEEKADRYTRAREHVHTRTVMPKVVTAAAAAATAARRGGGEGERERISFCSLCGGG